MTTLNNSDIQKTLSLLREHYKDTTTALNFTSPFCTCNYGGKCFSKETAVKLNIEY